MRPNGDNHRYSPPHHHHREHSFVGIQTLQELWKLTSAKKIIFGKFPNGEVGGNFQSKNSYMNFWIEKCNILHFLAALAALGLP